MRDNPYNTIISIGLWALLSVFAGYGLGSMLIDIGMGKYG